MAFAAFTNVFLKKATKSFFIFTLLIVFNTSTSASHLSDEIALKNTYQYRVLTRELASNPSDQFSDNVRPIAQREINLINLKMSNGKRFYSNQYVQVQPVDSLRLQTLHNSASNGLISGNFGETFAGHNYSSLNVDGSAFINNAVLLSHETRVQYDSAQSDVYLYRYRVKTAFSKLSFSMAKDSLILGPGYFGNLISSNNSQPYQIAMLKTEVPYSAGLLGQFRWYVWHSWFDNGSANSPDAKMLGIRFAIKPSKYIDLSITRTSSYGGNGQDIDSFDKLFNVITAKDENAKTNIDTDQLLGFDASLYLPFLKKFSPFLGGKLYTEFLVNDVVLFWQTEDLGDKRIIRFLDQSSLFGLYLTTGKLDFHFEYVKTANAIYGHQATGASGSSVNGYIIGHFIGRDSNAYLSEVYYEWIRNFHISLNTGIIVKGQRLANSQTTNTYGIGFKYFITPKAQLEMKTTYLISDRTDINPSPISYNFIEESNTDWHSVINLSYQF